MKWFADPELRPGRDGLNVFNVRAYTAPVQSAPDLSFEFEYASERNGDALDSNAWTLQGAYELSAGRWTPKLSYRYAFFEGDDPDTTANEAFDPLFLGFYDWGTWWQGEIAGEYFLSNSNLVSHLVRAHAVAERHDRRRAAVLQVPGSIKPASVGAGRDRQGPGVRDRRLRGLEAEQQFHGQSPRRLCQPGKGVSRRPAAPRTSRTGWSTSATASDRSEPL